MHGFHFLSNPERILVAKFYGFYVCCNCKYNSHRGDFCTNCRKEKQNHDVLYIK